MTTLELVQYYSGLLIKQYKGLPNAKATIELFVGAVLMPQTSVQVVSFTTVPTSGAIVLSYDDISAASIAWNDNAAAWQTKLRAVTGLSSTTVTGDSTVGFTVTFIGVTPPALSLIVDSSTLRDVSVDLVEVSIDETDLTLPLAVLNGYNLIGDNIAVGDQLDVLGKYAGVTRSGTILSGEYVTLDDTDFLQLIRMAIITNNAGSSLETIQNFLQQFFPGQIFVTDYKGMRLSYLMDSTVGSTNLVQLMITEKLLPKPMGVGLSLAVVPDVTVLYAFRTYQFTVPNGKPFNRYGAFDLSWRWLSYANMV